MSHVGKKKKKMHTHKIFSHRLLSSDNNALIGSESSDVIYICDFESIITGQPSGYPVRRYSMYDIPV